MEFFRVFLYDDASEQPDAVRVIRVMTEKSAMLMARCLTHQHRGELDRYCIEVHRFWGPNGKFRSVTPLFRSAEKGWNFVSS